MRTVTGGILVLAGTVALVGAGLLGESPTAYGGWCFALLCLGSLEILGGIGLLRRGRQPR